ncbi:hypothetical protein C8R45DRAFT_994181 [Mycena sanguinolenta]|nr:hypothetical protein C8R45DRAFT_994181 [Mycena sanguinolenta]
MISFLKYTENRPRSVRGAILCLPLLSLCHQFHLINLHHLFACPTPRFRHLIRLNLRLRLARQSIIADCRCLSVTVKTTSVTVRPKGISLPCESFNNSTSVRYTYCFRVPQPVESSTNFSTGSEFERPYIQGSGISAPNFTSEVASPISIETIPSYVEAREWGRRKGPEKMHRCEICGKEFPRPSAVNTHMNVHNNARPFPCGFPNCPKTFSVRSNARRHHRTHSEKALPPTSPLPSHSGFQFAELIVPEPRPLPLPPSPNQSSFRVRWVANNTTTRPRLAPSTKRSGKKSNASGMTDNSDDEQPPILLYDPFSGTQGSHDVREI